MTLSSRVQVSHGPTESWNRKTKRNITTAKNILNRQGSKASDGSAKGSSKTFATRTPYPSNKPFCNLPVSIRLLDGRLGHRRRLQVPLIVHVPDEILELIHCRCHISDDV